MKDLRVAIYCRVACDDGFTLEKQAATLQRYAEKAGYTIVGIMAEHESGLTLNRPALKAVTKAVYSGKVDAVLVQDLSRIGRGWGIVQSYIDLLEEHKVSLLCVTDRLEITSNQLLAKFLDKK